MSKKNKKNEKVKSRWWIGAIFTICSKIYLFLFYNVKIDRKVLKKQKRGCILVYNHYSDKDHYFVAASSNCRRINYVLSSRFFFNKFLSFILNLARSIKKDQFKPDLLAIRKIKKVIDQNGIIAIAPAGQISINGAPIYVSPVIVKLIRMCKADVIALRMQGTHLTCPKWSLSKRKCKINLTYLNVLNKEDIDSYSDEEIYNKVVESIGVNEYTDQVDKKRIIKGKNIIAGLENVLIKCPKCGSYYCNETNGNEMSCTKCNNTVIMDKYGFLKPKSEEDVYFEDEVKWYSYQKQELKQEFDKEDFSFSIKVKMTNNLAEEDKMEYAGDGVLTLTKNRLFYEGTCHNEHYTKDFNFEQLVQLPFGVAPLSKQYVEVPDAEGTFSFEPIEERRAIVRLVQYVDIINENRQ